MQNTFHFKCIFGLVFSSTEIISVCINLFTSQRLPLAVDANVMDQRWLSHISWPQRALIKRQMGLTEPASPGHSTRWLILFQQAFYWFPPSPCWCVYRAVTLLWSTTLSCTSMWREHQPLWCLLSRYWLDFLFIIPLFVVAFCCFLCFEVPNIIYGCHIQK